MDRWTLFFGLTGAPPRGTVGDMHLREYLNESGKPKISVRWLAKKMKVSHSTLNRILSGEIRPSGDMMLRLYRATDQKVTPNDMLLDVVEKLEADCAE